MDMEAVSDRILFRHSGNLAIGKSRNNMDEALKQTVFGGANSFRPI